MEENSLFTVKGRLGTMLVRPLVFCAIFTLFWACTAEQSDDLAEFDVGEGPAVETLKEAARQAEVEFIFSSGLVEEVRTPAVKGKYTPFHAFELMLADSPFIVVQHQESGVYSIQRSPNQ